ncbi:MAG: c-type cytochrome [Wenzhouxiangellaceae bacterium]
MPPWRTVFWRGLVWPCLALLLMASSLHSDERCDAIQQRLCQSCHPGAAGLDHGVGPNLWGLAQRDIASAPGYDYSPALKSLNGRWDATTLNAFLSNPMAFAPGNHMAYAGVTDAEVRAELIAWLARLNDPPVAWSIAVPDGDSAALSTGETLIPAAGAPLVAAWCGGCHSIELVTQQRLDREGWRLLLQWMQEEQGMPEMPVEHQVQVLDYLATHYGMR